MWAQGVQDSKQLTQLVDRANDMNAAKARIFTTTTSPEVAYIDVGSDMIQVTERHICTSDGKCVVTFDANQEQSWRIVSAAWGKFNKLRFIFVNKHLSIKGIEAFHRRGNSYGTVRTFYTGSDGTTAGTATWYMPAKDVTKHCWME